MSELSRERMLHLLADQATEGLGAKDTQELQRLLEDSVCDEHGLELAAAAMNLAFASGKHEALPSGLRDQILFDAGKFFGGFEGAPMSQWSGATPLADTSSRFKRHSVGQFGWYLAAACFLLAVMGWWPSSTTERDSIASVGEKYVIFLRETPDLIRAPWTAQQTGYEKVSGDVVWSNSGQCGFMRFVGLPANDPKTTQYQLWIVDPERDKNPVDGGVFDVDSTNEVVIQFDSTLPVQNPKVFAITREKPGGVVVSDGPLLVVGSVSS